MRFQILAFIFDIGLVIGMLIAGVNLWTMIVVIVALHVFETLLLSKAKGW